MTAYNIVKVRVKPGREKDFLDVEKTIAGPTKGFRKGAVIKTGERTYHFVGEWNSMDDVAAGRSEMIAGLDRVRDMLEDLGGGLGVTDPVSGEAVIEYP